MPVAVGAIGAGALSWVGVSVAASSIVAGIVGGAIVGAVVGGLTTAITGGDIGKGILFGAVGGAVLGGASAWLGGGGLTTGVETAGQQGLSSGATSVSMNENVAGGAATETIGEGTKEGLSGGFMSSLGDGAGAALVTTGGTMLAGAFDDSAKVANKLERDKMKQQNEQFYAQLEATERMSKGGGGGASGDAAKYAADLQLLNAREQRQADWKLKQKEFSLIDEQRARRRGTLTGLKARNAPSGKPAQPSVQQQVFDESKAMYGEEANPADNNGLLYGNR